MCLCEVEFCEEEFVAEFVEVLWFEDCAGGWFCAVEEEFCEHVVVADLANGGKYVCGGEPERDVVVLVEEAGDVKRAEVYASVAEESAIIGAVFGGHAVFK